MQLYHHIHDGNGPYMLLVHGFLSSGAQWDVNLQALAQVARPVVVELWGHHRSPSPTDPALYHPDSYVEMFERLRQQLGVERWLVCGQSLGGALTLRYALRHPERLFAQVFTNSNSALADMAWMQARRASAAEQADAMERDGAAALETMRVHPIHAKRLPPEAHARLLADARLHNPRGIAATLRYTTLNSPVRDQVGKLRVPTLLVCGERERRFAAFRAFAEATIPGLQVVGAPGGHAVNIESAEEFNAAVVAFIGKATTSTCSLRYNAVP